MIGSTSASAEFTPSRPLPTPLLLNVAFPGFDLVTDVAAGDNVSKRLQHNFMVLAVQQYRQAPGDDRHHWPLDGLTTAIPADATGIALSVDPTPLQATGGWLR